MIEKNNKKLKKRDMAILLVAPLWYGGSGLDKLISKVPPLGLAYIAAVLEKEGFGNIRIVDMKAEKIGFGELRDIIFNFKPKILGVSLATGQVSSGTKLIKIAKEIDKDIICMIGGPHPSALPEKTLEETDADVCIFGEGELTTLEFVKAVYEGKELDGIRGLAFKKNGAIKKNPPRALISNLDDIPFPARHLILSTAEYSKDSETALTSIHATMMTSRGCPFRCAFCDKSVFGRSFRYRSAKNVVDEIETLVKSYNVQSIRFFDDILTAIPKRVKEICDELIKRNLKIKWSCEARVNTVNPEMLKMMKNAGCTEMHFGIESGDQKILDLQQKDITLDQAREAVKWTNEAGIESRGYFIIGLPGDTKKTINETIQFGRSLNLGYIGIFMFTPYPGTFERKYRLEDYGAVLAKSWDDYVTTFEKPSFVPKGMTAEELTNAYKKAYLLMHLNLKTIINLLKSAKSFPKIKSYIKAFFWSVGLKR